MSGQCKKPVELLKDREGVLKYSGGKFGQSIEEEWNVFYAAELVAEGLDFGVE